MAEHWKPNRSDLAGDKGTQLLLWQLPTAAVVLSSLLKDSPLRAGVWTAAFTQMGLACLANAARCGRLHCYFTGPLFLSGGLASFLRGLGLIRVSWNQIGLGMLLGWLLLGRLPERVWGRYAPWRSSALSMPPDRFARCSDWARKAVPVAHAAQGT